MALPIFRVAGTFSGNSPQTAIYPAHDAGTAVTAGQAVKLNVEGAVEGMDDADENLSGVAANSQATTGGDVTVWLANGDTYFSCVVVGTFASLILGQIYDHKILGVDQGSAGNDNIWMYMGPDTTDSERGLFLAVPSESIATGAIAAPAATA